LSPDFLEKPDMIQYETKTVLGKIFRRLKDEGKMKSVKKEYDFSIDYLYKLNTHFIRDKKEFSKHVSQVYHSIVWPFAQDIKLLLMDNQLLSETDLFCTDYHF
jgi:hypothetical protein